MKFIFFNLKEFKNVIVHL